jgi:hypothetical protein
LYRLLTVVVGGNDVCEVCNDATPTTDKEYEKHMVAVFEVLKEVPRLIVNIVLLPDFSLLRDIDWGWWGNTVCSSILAGESALSFHRPYIFNEPAGRGRGM